MDVAVLRAILEGDASSLYGTLDEAKRRLEEFGSQQLPNIKLKATVEMPDSPTVGGSGGSGASPASRGSHPSTADPVKIEATTQAGKAQVAQIGEAKLTNIHAQGQARRLNITMDGEARELVLRQSAAAKLETAQRAFDQNQAQRRERAALADEIVAQRAAQRAAARAASTPKESVWKKASEYAEREGNQKIQSGALLTATATAPIVGGIGLAARESIQWEQSFAGVRKTVDGTTEQIRALELELRNLAAGPAAIPIDVNQLAAIAENAGQLGVARENITSFTKTVADLAKTTNLTADQAGTDLAQLANITGMPQSAFDRLGSTIVDLGNHGASTESQIVEMSLRIAGAGKQVGLSEPQILGFASALASVGIEAEAGGSSISTAFIKIDKAVRDGGDELAAYAKVAGMSSAQFRDSWQRDAASATTAFISGIKKLSDSGGNVFAVFDKLGLSEIRLRDALLRASNAGSLFGDSIKTANTAWQQNTALSNEAGKRYETTASQLEILKNRLRELALQAGGGTLKAANAQLETLSAAVPVIGRDIAVAWDGIGPAMQKAVIGFTALVAFSGPLTTIAGTAQVLHGKLLDIVGLATNSGGIKGAITGLLGNPAVLLGIVAALGVGYLAWTHYSEKIKAVQDIQAELGRNSQALGNDLKKALDLAGSDTGTSKAIEKIRAEVQAAGTDVPKLDAALNDLTKARREAEISAKLSPTEKSAVLDAFDAIAHRIEARKIDVNLQLSQQSRTMLDTLSKHIADAVNGALKGAGLNGNVSESGVKNFLTADPIGDFARAADESRRPLTSQEIRARIRSSGFSTPGLEAERQRIQQEVAARQQREAEDERLYQLGILRRPKVKPAAGPLAPDPLAGDVSSLGGPKPRDPNANPGVPSVIWDGQQAARKAEQIKVNTRLLTDVSKASLAELNGALKNYDRLITIDKQYGRDYFSDHPQERARRDAILTRRNALQAQAASGHPKMAESEPEDDSKAARAALKAQKDALNDQAQAWERSASAAENSVERQLRALGQLRGELGSFFGTLQDNFTRMGVIDDPMGDVIGSLEKMLDLSGQAHRIAEPTIRRVDDLRQRAAGKRSEVERLNGLDGEVPTRGGNLVGGGGGKAPSWLAAMEADSGKNLGRNCAQEITARLRSSGFSIGAISAASQKSTWQVGFDANGRLPAGTIVRYPPHMAGRGQVGDRHGHYAAIGSDGAHWTESNVADTNLISARRRAINWEKLQRDVAARRAYAFAPPGSLEANATAPEVRNSGNRSYVPATTTKGADTATSTAPVEPSRLREMLGEFDGSLAKVHALPKGWGAAVRDMEGNTARFTGQLFLASDAGSQMIQRLSLAMKKPEFKTQLAELSKALGTPLTVHGTGQNAATDLFRQVLNQADVKLNRERTAQEQSDAGSKAAKDRTDDIVAHGRELENNVSMLQLEKSLLGQVGRSQAETNDLVEIERRRRERVAQLLESNKGLSQDNPRRISGEQARSIADSEAALERQTAALRRNNSEWAETNRLGQDAKRQTDALREAQKLLSASSADPTLYDKTLWTANKKQEIRGSLDADTKLQNADTFDERGTLLEKSAQNLRDSGLLVFAALSDELEKRAAQLRAKAKGLRSDVESQVGKRLKDATDLYDLQESSTADRGYDDQMRQRRQSISLLELENRLLRENATSRDEATRQVEVEKARRTALQEGLKSVTNDQQRELASGILEGKTSWNDPRITDPKTLEAIRKAKAVGRAEDVSRSLTKEQGGLDAASLYNRSVADSLALSAGQRSLYGQHNASSPQLQVELDLLRERQSLMNGQEFGNRRAPDGSLSKEDQAEVDRRLALKRTELESERELSLYAERRRASEDAQIRVLEAQRDLQLSLARSERERLQIGFQYDDLIRQRREGDAYQPPTEEEKQGRVQQVAQVEVGDAIKRAQSTADTISGMLRSSVSEGMDGGLMDFLASIPRKLAQAMLEAEITRWSRKMSGQAEDPTAPTAGSILIGAMGRHRMNNGLPTTGGINGPVQGSNVGMSELASRYLPPVQHVPISPLQPMIDAAIMRSSGSGILRGAMNAVGGSGDGSSVTLTPSTVIINGAASVSVDGATVTVEGGGIPPSRSNRGRNLGSSGPISVRLEL